MDLKFLKDEPSHVERLAVDRVLGPEPEAAPPVSLREAKARRTLLLPALHALQSRVGWVSRGGLAYVSRRLAVPPAEAFGVASFYALFALTERPAAFAHVCDDVACHAVGAEAVCAELEKSAGPSAHGHSKTEGRQAHGGAWARSPCLGLCEQAPAAMVTRAGDPSSEVAFGGATAAKVASALKGDAPSWVKAHVGVMGPRRLLKRVNVVDPASLDEYRAHGGYEALRKALELGPEAVLREVTDAKLVGRGGAAFPTGRKWEAVARAPVRPHFVVCNADESEPGTFKDRVLMEGDPFALVEAMTLAGFATGSERGTIYLRGEYPMAWERLSHAISAARAKGLLGRDVMGKGVTFELELRKGAGAYICGEETALFASIEGFRGEPRTKPPFPVSSGLFGKPTAINNVETLIATLDIVRDGAKAYASVGTSGSPGTKLFCVSGKVRNGGAYEVPFGTTLGELLALAGGTEKKPTAILLGGAAGTFVTPEQLDLKLSFEDTKKAGTTLGSGVVLVLDETVSLWPILKRIAAFFRDESCGQCVPCRVGTVRQEELLSRLAGGASAAEELKLYAELSQAMRDASICGLGQTATSAIESALPRLVQGGAR